MAVFPDRIVLKNSTDARATIETAIQSGGTDEIQQGELVIGRESGAAKLYTLDSNGDIAVVGGAQSINELTDVDTSTNPPSNGQTLVWVAANSNWEPGSAVGSGGRGDGGDLDTSVVLSGFVFGVYGGGDLDALNATAVAPFAHGRIDVNNITGGTLAGMTAAAHVYSSGVNSYIDFTFATAQPNADYDVVVTWEIGPELHEVQSKTVNGFRVDFYDMGTGNYMSSGAVAISQPVVSVYASDPTIGVNSDAGVDYPVELLSDGGTPDGGDIT